MLYGVEINEPYQVGAEHKVRCMLVVSEDENHAMSWGREPEYEGRPNRVFCTTDEAAARAVASTLAYSWDASVVPVEGGIEFSPETMPAVVRKFKERARTATREARHIR